MLGIGVDTGGTYTDAVVFDDVTREVLASCKTLTTPDDLTVCIGEAIDKLPPEIVRKAQRVSLSTTLATNACIEGKGGRAKLVIAGTTESVLHRVDAPTRYGMAYKDVLPVDFKGSFDGMDVTLPNWEAISDQNPEFFADADSLGIAGLYALNNGAAVEHSAADYYSKKYGIPVVKATDVALSPNVLERGATALLNARLIPIIEGFIEAMKKALDDRGLHLPIGIVRSNGTLMSAQSARKSPVETIVSGPAASAVSALSLTSTPDSLVIDIGGTTSDIAIVHNGRPATVEGVRIGRWRTQVKGAYIDTIGLGGDTRVLISKTGEMSLSNRRALPLCVAARRWPIVKEALHSYIDTPVAEFTQFYELMYLANEPKNPEHYNASELSLLDKLAEGPISLLTSSLSEMGVNPTRLEEEGVVMRCGFTPTDAMHVKGDFDTFDAEASKLGALCIWKSTGHNIMRVAEDGGTEAEAEVAKALDDAAIWVADKVYDLVERRLYGQIMRVLLQDRYTALRGAALGEQLEVLIDDAWRRFADGVQPNSFDVDFCTNMTLVGIGAPTHVFLPRVAEALKAPCVIPDHAEVANAIGALCARVIVEEVVHVVTHRTAGGTVDGHIIQSRGMNKMVVELDEALEIAKAHARETAIAEARQRGMQGEIDCTVSVDMQNVLSLGYSTQEWFVLATAREKADTE